MGRELPQGAGVSSYDDFDIAQLALHSHPENRNTVVFESYYKVSGMN